jgi:ribonuclease HI
MTQHISKVCASVLPLLERLKLLSRKLPAHLLRQLYLGAIASRLRFAGAIFWPRATDSARESLEVLHRAGARLISGAIGTCPNAAALAEARMEPLATIIAKDGCRLAAKLVRLVDHFPSARGLCKATDTPATTLPSLTTGQGLFANFWVEPAPPQGREPPFLGPACLPWKLAPSRCVHIESFTGAPYSKEDDPATLRAVNAARITSVGAHDLLVATDGGVTNGRAYGGAILYTSAGVELSRRAASAGPLACSYSAEIVGFRLGLALLEELCSDLPSASPRRIILLSDSQSLLSTLERGPLRQRSWATASLWEHMTRLTVTGCCLSLIFVFAHVGTPANEAVDAMITAILDAPPPPNDPHAPLWHVDESRSRWTLFAARSETSQRAAAPFRTSLLPADAPWFAPLARTASLTRADERLLSQLRTGVCPLLPGWRHEAPMACLLCDEADAYRRDGGAAVAHCFACPAPAAIAARGSLTASSLFPAPAAALQYVRHFASLLVAAHHHAHPQERTD